MLVLSRHPSEKIVFPDLDVAIQVVSIKSGAVRLGIEAPPEVIVCREEILDRPHAAAGRPEVPAPALTAEAQARHLRHQVRNRLNAATVGLALLRQQLRRGLHEAAGHTLGKLDEEFQELRRLSAPPEKPRPARVRKALIVEDDRNECELLAGFLRLSGVDVATAGDGTDALDYLRHNGRPDVVLLDMVLPRCDGATTLREIRRNPANAGLRVFAMTGHAREQFQLDGGVDDWLQKPLNPEDLLRKLDLHAAPPA